MLAVVSLSSASETKPLKTKARFITPGLLFKIGYCGSSNTYSISFFADKSTQLTTGLLWRLLACLRLGAQILIGPFADVLAFVGDLHVRTEALVVGVFHHLPDVNVTAGKVQYVVHLGVDREPVPAVDAIAPGREVGEQVLLAALFHTEVGHVLAVGLDDL